MLQVLSEIIIISILINTIHYLRALVCTRVPIGRTVGGSFVVYDRRCCVRNERGSIDRCMYVRRVRLNGIDFRVSKKRRTNSITTIFIPVYTYTLRPIHTSSASRYIVRYLNTLIYIPRKILKREDRRLVVHILYNVMFQLGINLFPSITTVFLFI